MSRSTDVKSDSWCGWRRSRGCSGRGRRRSPSETEFETAKKKQWFSEILEEEEKGRTILPLSNLIFRLDLERIVFCF